MVACPNWQSQKFIVKKMCQYVSAAQCLFKSSLLNLLKPFCAWEEWSLLHKLLFTQDVPSDPKWLIKKQFTKFKSISFLMLFTQDDSSDPKWLIKKQFTKFKSNSFLMLFTQDDSSNPKWLSKKQFTKFKSVSFLGETKVFCLWGDGSLLCNFL